MPLRVLLVGKGAREHALAWKLAESPSVHHVYVVPGNGGTAQGLAKVSNLPQPKDYPGYVKLAQEKEANLAVIGPDDEVVGGLEAHFREAGIPCFSPTQEAAVVEGSKAFSKSFMKRHNIPTASYETFASHADALDYLSSPQAAAPNRLVIKADGLAAGKGVILPSSREEAEAALSDMMLNAKFGTAGDAVVVEEFLEGDEISVLTFSDGNTFKSLPPGQDHKRAFDGHKGPNTGGMGVYTPTPFVSEEDIKIIDEQILRPTFAGLKSEGRTFSGLLFTGIMMTASGPKVLEYNARFGDPETQAMLCLLDTDLSELLWACTRGTLADIELKTRPAFACNVVVAAGGYPESYRKGDVITIGKLPDDVRIFHSGTDLSGGQLKTSGGRVLSVVATGQTLEEAVKRAYEGVKAVEFKDLHYRTDIASRCVRLS